MRPCTSAVSVRNSPVCPPERASPGESVGEEVCWLPHRGSGKLPVKGAGLGAPENREPRGPCWFGAGTSLAAASE